jgi:hypothetical protein
MGNAIHRKMAESADATGGRDTGGKDPRNAARRGKCAAKRLVIMLMEVTTTDEMMLAPRASRLIRQAMDNEQEIV